MRMKKLFYFLLAAVMLSACASAEIQVDTRNLTDKYGEHVIVEASGDITLVFMDAGGSKDVKFTSAKPWSAQLEGDADWLSFTPTQGETKEAQMKITVSQNGYDNRNAVVKLISEDVVTRFCIEQKQKDALTVTQSSFSLPGDGGQIEIEVKSNIDFSCTISDNAAKWIKQVGTKGLAINKLRFDILPTDVQSERTGVISIGAPGRTSENITVTQEPKYRLSAPSGCSVSNSKSEFIVNFDTNARIVAESSVNWIKPVTTYKSDGKSLKFSADANPGVAARTGNITLKSDDGLISATVKVMQEDTLHHCNGYGIFSVNGHKSTLLRNYESGEDQRVFAEGQFTFQNYAKEEYFSLIYAAPFKKGYTQDIKVIALGIDGVIPHQGKVKAYQKTSNAVWLYDEGAALVYVFNTDSKE